MKEIVAGALETARAHTLEEETKAETKKDATADAAEDKDSTPPTDGGSEGNTPEEKDAKAQEDAENEPKSLKKKVDELVTSKISGWIFKVMMADSNFGGGGGYKPPTAKKAPKTKVHTHNLHFVFTPSFTNESEVLSHLCYVSQAKKRVQVEEEEEDMLDLDAEDAHTEL